MINQSYRLVAPKQVRIDFIDEKITSDDVIIRPKYLSICAADQRYYTGNRDKEVLRKKLPMALIHEAVGEVVYDPTGKLKKGAPVVMIPNTPHENDNIIKENYRKSSSFRASGVDGFMQSFVKIKSERIIGFDNIDYRIAVLLEIVSVAMNALEHFDKYSHLKKQVLGIWGDGSLGFVTSLVLKYTFPNAKIVVFGLNERKLNYFSFADEIYFVNDMPTDIEVDHAFECVGGAGSEAAINQIIDIINPEGSIALLGVSENYVSVNTRMVLEKGLTILGNSRSGYEDFERAIEFMQSSDTIKNYLQTIISEEIIVRELADIHTAFNNDLKNDFKTIMKWEI